MKKLKKLNLKKMKIANVNTLYALRGGETETCLSTVCNTDICDTVPQPTADGVCSTIETGHTTTHTNAISIGCISGDGNNNNGGTQQSIEIC